MIPRLPDIEERREQDPGDLQAWVREHLQAGGILELLGEPTRVQGDHTGQHGDARYTWVTPEGWEVSIEAYFTSSRERGGRVHEGPWATGYTFRADGRDLGGENLSEASVVAENIAYTLRRIRSRHPTYRWPEYFGLHCEEDPCLPWPVVVPDLHGRADLLDAVVAAYPDRHLILLGDYVDRGPDSRGVIDRVRDLVTRGRATALIGNHDELMIRSVLDDDDSAKFTWVHNGGEATMESYGNNWAALRADAQWMRDHLHLELQYGGYLFTHAGRPMPGDTRDTQLWLRPEDRPLPPLPEGLHTSVHGHTVMPAPEQRRDRHGTRAWYLDTGAVRTGVLTVLDLDTQAPVEIRAQP